MDRNEYRRAFIMLRAAAQSYGGHVRLERRTLTGSMYFIVTAPPNAGQLVATLVGRQNGEYYVAPVGRLARDRRGQLTLAWQFDPRAIDGRPLEAYAWVVVAQADGTCRVALTGNVEGARQMDLAALSRAVCERLAPQAPPAADLPDPDEPPPEAPPQEDMPPADPPPEAPPKDAPSPEDMPQDAPPQNPSPQDTPSPEVPPPEVPPQNAPPQDAPSPEDMPQDAPDSEKTAGDIKIYTRARTRRLMASRARAARAAQGEKAAEPDAPAAPQPETPEPRAEGNVQPAASGENPSDAKLRRTAAQQLGLDITQPWPDAAEPLRRLFATQAPAAFEPADGYTYVRAPMPEGCGYDACLIGLRAADGQIQSIRYALPDRYAPEPPAGMEGYRWIGRNGAGFWALDTEVPGNPGVAARSAALP